MDKKGMFIGGLVIAASRFVLMPIIAAVLIVVGLFTDILATWIGCVFFAMYILLCVIFGVRVAAVSDTENKE